MTLGAAADENTTASSSRGTGKLRKVGVALGPAAAPLPSKGTGTAASAAVSATSRGEETGETLGAAGNSQASKSATVSAASSGGGGGAPAPKASGAAAAAAPTVSSPPPPASPAPPPPGLAELLGQAFVNYYVNNVGSPHPCRLAQPICVIAWARTCGVACGAVGLALRRAGRGRLSHPGGGLLS